MRGRVPAIALLLGLVGVIAFVPGVALAETHDAAPADPETDVLGWEDGYWYNETLPVDPSDGFNDSEVNATVARAMARVERIRGLEFNRTVPVEIRTRAEYRNRTRNRSVDPRLRTFDNAKFEALLLVGEDEDSIEIQRANRAGGDLGLYNFAADRIVLIAPSEGPVSLNEYTLAHELVHALQDQHFNLSRYHRSTRDGTNGLQGLLEGDPGLVEYRYRERCASTWPGECYRPDGDAVGEGGGIAHIGVNAVKIQPYSDGPSFVQSLIERGGWDAVNAAYERPPVSAEQVIHPSRYPEATPVNVSLSDRASDAWTRVRPSGRPAYETFGEASLVAMLVYPYYDSRGLTRIIPPDRWFNRADGGLDDFDPLNYDTDYTDGWDGDRFHAYENEAGETAYVWRLQWSTETDANEFVRGYRRALSYWGAERVDANTWVIEDGAFADAFRVIVRGRTVTIVNAPTEAGLDTVWPPRVTIDPRTAANGSTLAVETPDRTRIPPTAAAPTADTPADTRVDSGQPGFGPAVAVLAVLLAALARLRDRS